MSARKIKIGFFVALTLFFLPTSKIAFADSFVKDSYPVFTSDIGGGWEINSVANPNILYHEGKFKMWYGANSNFKWAIGYTTSPNGKTNWETIETPVVTSYPLEEWDEMEVGHPSVIYTEEKKYEMWFIGTSTRWQGGNDRFRAKYATSNDGIDWDMHPQYVLKGTENSWDRGGISRGISVIRTHKGYEMWYTGIDGSNSNWKIGYAFSEDGINWTKYPNNENPQPVIEPTKSWELNWVSYPEVFYDGYFYHMFYTAASKDTGERVVYAISTDSIHWEKPNNEINPIITLGSPESFDSKNIVTPSVIRSGGIHKMWYAGHDGNRWKIGYAEGSLPEPTVTPTPSPAPTPLQPLVLLPGLGASWNHRAMVLSENRPQSEWYMTPGVKIYDGLIETLKNAGYQTEEPGKNLFIFNYNWTQPVNITTNELKDFIQNVVHPPLGTKIDLVGHSMGGFVSRTYVQNNPDHPVDQVLTLGSPLKGVPHLYYVWEGGDLKNTLENWPPWQRFALTLLVYLRKSAFSTLAETVQAIVPSLHNLLPTFNYLKQNGQEKPIDQMTIKNEWLSNLNSSLPFHLLSVLNNFVAILPASTVRWIHVGPHGWLDEVLNLWVDGKPTGAKEFDVGDTTVLAESAQVAGTNVINLEGINHTQLVETTTGIEKIISILNLSPSEIVPAPTVSWEPSLVFILASPATISVFDPGDNPVGESDGQTVVVPGAIAGEYRVKLTGTGDGKYHLYIGQIATGQEIWNTISGNINSDEEHIYKVNFNPSSPLETPLVDLDGSLNLTNARNKIAELRNLLNQAGIDKNCQKALLIRINLFLKLLNENRIEGSIATLYKLRLKTNACGPKKINEATARSLKNKIQEIISDLEESYVIIQTNKGGSYPSRLLEKEIALVQKNFVRMETRLKKLAGQGKAKPDYGALYLLASGKLNRARQSSSYEAHINALGAKALSQESLRFFR